MSPRVSPGRPGRCPPGCPCGCPLHIRENLGKERRRLAWTPRPPHLPGAQAQNRNLLHPSERLLWLPSCSGGAPPRRSPDWLAAPRWRVSRHLNCGGGACGGDHDWPVALRCPGSRPRPPGQWTRPHLWRKLDVRKRGARALCIEVLAGPSRQARRMGRGPQGPRVGRATPRAARRGPGLGRSVHRSGRLGLG